MQLCKGAESSNYRGTSLVRTLSRIHLSFYGGHRVGGGRLLVRKEPLYTSTRPLEFETQCGHRAVEIRGLQSPATALHTQIQLFNTNRQDAAADATHSPEAGPS